MGNDIVTMQDGQIKASICEAIRKLTEGAGPDIPAEASQHGPTEQGPANAHKMTKGHAS